MPRPTLTVVGGGERQPDAEVREITERTKERLDEVVAADGVFWVLTEVGGLTSVAYVGGKLETSALVEEVARRAKAEALGL